jgi:hypothetical protein
MASQTPAQERASPTGIHHDRTTAPARHVGGACRAHTHALLDIFPRSSLDAMIADSNCIIPLSGRAERRIFTPATTVGRL